MKSIYRGDNMEVDYDFAFNCPHCGGRVALKIGTTNCPECEKPMYQWVIGHPEGFGGMA